MKTFRCSFLSVSTFAESQYILCQMKSIVKTTYHTISNQQEATYHTCIISGSPDSSMVRVMKSIPET